MKKLSCKFKDKRLVQAAAILRQWKASRGKTDGAVLLAQALSQIEAGDARTAQQTLNRVELIVARLSMEDRAVLQGIRESIEPRVLSRVGDLMLGVASSAVWQWLYSLLHNYLYGEYMRQNFGIGTCGPSWD